MVVGLIRDIPTARELVDRIMDEAHQLMTPPAGRLAFRHACVTLGRLTLPSGPAPREAITPSSRLPRHGSRLAIALSTS